MIRRVAAAALAVAVLASSPAAGATMLASFYGAESGRVTASGAAFQPMGFTAAHRSLPLGARLTVCLRRCVVVTITDRGPALWTGRAIDLSRGAARAIGLESIGVARVEVGTLGGSSPRPDHHRRHR